MPSRLKNNVRNWGIIWKGGGEVRKEWGVKKLSLLVGRFSLLEAALRAKVVRWIIDVELLFHSRLV